MSSLRERRAGISCHLGTGEGRLFLHTDGVLFAPVCLFIPRARVAGVATHRVSGASATFAVHVVDTDGERTEFGQVDAREEGAVSAFVLTNKYNAGLAKLARAAEAGGEGEAPAQPQAPPIPQQNPPRDRQPRAGADTSTDAGSGSDGDDDSDDSEDESFFGGSDSDEDGDGDDDFGGDRLRGF
jgi:hypothetical protein